LKYSKKFALCFSFLDHCVNLGTRTGALVLLRTLAVICDPGFSKWVSSHSRDLLLFLLTGVPNVCQSHPHTFK